MTGRSVENLLLVGVLLALAFGVLLQRDTPPPPPERGGHGPFRPVALAPKGASVRRGASLFRLRGCLGCHQVKGAGGVVGPDLGGVGVRWRREALLDRLEGHTLLMPDFGHLPSEEKRELVEYLMTLR